MLFNIFPPEKLIERYLPLAVPLNEDASVILLEDGSVFSMFEITPVPWETEDAANLIQQHARLNATICQTAHPSVVWHVWQCRGEIDQDLYPKGKFRSAFAEELDIAYHEKLESLTFYSNQTFIGIQIRPSQTLGLSGEGKAKKTNSEDAPHDRVERLENLLGLLKFNLAQYRPRILGIRDEIFSEVGEALAYAMTGVRRPVPLTTGRIGQSILSEQIIVGRETIEYRGPGNSWYGAAFGLRHYLAETVFGVYTPLLSIEYPATLYQCFRILQTNNALDIIHKKQVSLVRSKDAIGEGPLEQAKRDLASTRTVLGAHSLTYLVFARSPEAMKTVASAAWSRLSTCGGTVAREGLALEAALFSLAPGNLHLHPRPGYISSINFTAMNSMNGYPRGEKTGYWGSPVAVFRTISGEPYLFHFHVRDVGIILGFGRTGAGKSMVLGFLLAQSERLGPKAVVWDKRKGLKILILSLGGSYSDLDFPTYIDPLKRLENTEENRQFLATLYRGCIQMDGKGMLSSDEERRLRLGIQMVMELPPHERWLEEVRGFLGVAPESAGARLQKWCWDEAFGGIIDNPEDRVELDAPIIGFDQDKFLDNPVARGPIMATLYHYTGRLANGKDRRIFAIDEFWKALQEPAFEPIISTQLKEIARKGNCSTILFTQSPRDALKSSLAHTLREQAPTQFYFTPGDSPSFDDYGPNGMGCTEQEFKIICGLPMGTGEFLLRQGGKSTRASMPMEGMDQQIAIISGRDENVTKFMRIRAEQPDIVSTINEFRVQTPRQKELVK